MKELESENTRLKKILADKILDYDILQEGYNLLEKAIAPITQHAIVREISSIKKVSLRRASRVLGARRSSLYYNNKRKSEDKEIAELLHLKVTEHPNWGFLLLFHWSKNQGNTWNKKRVYRVYKTEKLNLRKPKTRKKIKRVAINPLLVLLSFAAKSISAKKLVTLLKELIKEKGKPAYVRCDNGRGRPVLNLSAKSWLNLRKTMASEYAFRSQESLLKTGWSNAWNTKK
ncbi:MAG: hypothetical protein U5N85_13230 [Arcicella sp.]|nr:hypothetical protein [Arcicella sp.]